MDSWQCAAGIMKGEEKKESDKGLVGKHPLNGNLKPKLLSHYLFTGRQHYQSVGPVVAFFLAFNTLFDWLR